MPHRPRPQTAMTSDADSLNLARYFRPYPSFNIPRVTHDASAVESFLRGGAAIIDTPVQPSTDVKNAYLKESRVEDRATVYDSRAVNSLVRGSAEIRDHSAVEASSLNEQAKVYRSFIKPGSALSNWAQVKNDSVVGKTILLDRAIVDDSAVFDSRISGTARIKHAYIDEAGLTGDVRVSDSCVRHGAALRGRAQISGGSLIEASEIDGNARVENSYISSGADLRGRCIVRNRSQVYDSDVRGTCLLDGAQLMRKAYLDGSTQMTQSLAMGIKINGDSRVLKGSVISGRQDQELSDIVVTGKSLLHNTQGRNIRVCCQSQVSNCDLRDAWVFGSSVDGIGGDQRLVSIGLRCPMSVRTQNMDLGIMTDAEIYDIWAQVHPELPSRRTAVS